MKNDAVNAVFATLLIILGLLLVFLVGTGVGGPGRRDCAMMFRHAGTRADTMEVVAHFPSSCPLPKGE